MKLIGALIGLLVTLVVFGALWSTIQTSITGAQLNTTDAAGKTLLGILPVLIIVGIVIAVIISLGILRVGGKTE